ncbi:MAG TPA: hypothetical protein VFC96_01960, partial [Anaerovoracaceae bacterium]|nr:hypothetical protein [Anaerovoracaceae bacterium]
YKIIPLQADVRKKLDAEKEQSKEEKEPVTKWKQEEESLGKIHQNWNAIEPAAIKANLDEKTRRDYENALDRLTINIGKQLPEESLLAAINLYGKYADITEVFDTSIPAEFFRVKYNVMMATVEAVRNNWQKADQHIVVAQEKWDNLQVQAKKSDKKSADCSKFSINDLHSAIKTGQIDLVMAKSSIVMKNLQKLEDKL